MEQALVVLFIMSLIVLCQAVSYMIIWSRVRRAIRSREPSTSRLVIRSFGADEQGMARALARHTRLDLAEIDELLDERRTGPLPVFLSARRAAILAAELRALGAEADVEPRNYPADPQPA